MNNGFYCCHDKVEAVMDEKILVLKGQGIKQKISSSFFVDISVWNEGYNKWPRKDRKNFQIIKHGIPPKIVSTCEQSISCHWVDLIWSKNCKYFDRLLEIWYVWSWFILKSFGRWFIKKINRKMCSRLVLRIEFWETMAHRVFAILRYH